MKTLTYFVAAFPGLIHLALAYVEMRSWTKLGTKALGEFFDDPTFFETTEPLAYHMGLYNAFLGLGLWWSLAAYETSWYPNPALFFLACMIVAGLEGWRTIGAKKLFFYQSVPALLALGVLAWTALAR